MSDSRVLIGGGLAALGFFALSCGDDRTRLTAAEPQTEPVVSPAWSVWMGKADYTYTLERVACWSLEERQQNNPDAGPAPDLSWTLATAVDCSSAQAVELTTTIPGSLSFEFALVWSADGYNLFVVPDSFSDAIASPTCAVESPSQVVSCTGSNLDRVPNEAVVEVDGEIRGSTVSSSHVAVEWRDSKSFQVVSTPSGAAWDGPAFTTRESFTSAGALPPWVVSISELFDADGRPKVVSTQGGNTTTQTASDGSAIDTLTHTVSVSLHPIRIMSPSGDPSATQGIPGVNEFVYEAGVLEVPLRAEIIGDHGLQQETKEWLEPRLSWTFEPVGDSHDLTPNVPDEQVQTRWCVTGASDQCYGGVRSAGSVTLGASSYKVVLRLEGLPRRYNHFGAKTFTLSFDPFPDNSQAAPYQVGEAVAEIFYYPTDRDHPVADSIAMTQEDLRVPLEGRDPETGLPIFLYETSGVEPNWAYYYTQLLQDYYEHELEVRYLREMRDGPFTALAAAPKMAEWVYFGGNPDTVWITESAYGTYFNASREATFGINAFANLLAHEEQHVDDVYVMSDPDNCGPYQINSLEPEGVQSGWSFSARGTVISSLHWAFNRYEEKGFPGLYNPGLDVLLDDDGDGVCNNGDELPPGQSELEVRAESASVVKPCIADLWNEAVCDLARLDWAAGSFNYDARGEFGL